MKRIKIDREKGLLTHQGEPLLKFFPTYATFNDTALTNVERLKFSATAQKNMEGCRVKYAASLLLPQPSDKNSPLVFGTLVHSLLEKLMQLPKTKRTKKFVKECALGLAENDREYAKKIEEAALGLYEIENPKQVEVYATEFLVDKNLGGVPFIGKIDRIDKTDEGLVIIDYKTGKMPDLKWGDAHGEQIQLYASALGGNVVGGKLYYLEEHQERIVEIDANKQKQALDKLAQAWQTHKADISNKNAPYSPSTLCGWCPVVNVCPARSRDASERFDRAYSIEELGIKQESPETAETVETVEPVVKEEKMVQQINSKNRFADAQPWVALEYPNGSSYQVRRIFRLVALAEKYVNQEDKIIELAKIFNNLIISTQQIVSTTNDVNAGIASLLEDTLRETLTFFPPPEDESQKLLWQQNVQRKMFQTCKIVLEVLKN